ncbi:hypothetical protein V9T40_002841 [Parthenolecanium corni]|uniref:Pre-mRNA-splicing factor Syf1/CRNKL1-like C-terminal HAT-repeats domain-containing protein n=1 Tax=Parthenolecanium corni TaxID=536013 RepID=A0AAN9Y601_9HEMI
MNSKSKRKSLPRLELEDYSFSWDTKPSILGKRYNENADDSSSDDEKIVVEKKRISKKEKKELERRKEQKLREIEEELLNLDNPRSVDQFDRLLLGSPNNSELWIKYMSFHLQATEFEKVRATAERALKTIDIKEQQERLNIWIALLNFENLYGTKETLEKCLEEAVRMNDDYTVYMKMLDIFVSSNKSQELDKLINKVSKKFKESLECWLNCSEAYFKIKEFSKARLLFQKALQSLVKKEHISFISRFALLENKYGFSEKAQTLFEHVLTTYPARTDVWSCYVDMLVKSNSIQIARQVLERARAQKLPPKKMKFLFTKSIAFEENHGNPEAVAVIKQEAERYISNYSKIFD